MEAKYGDMWELYMGSERQIWVARNEIIEKILASSTKTNYFNKGSYKEGLDEIQQHCSGISMNRDVESWRFYRKCMTNSIMSQSFLEKYHDTTQNLFGDMTCHWLKLGRNTQIDLAQWLPRFTTELIMITSSNQKTNLLDTYFNQLLRKDEKVKLKLTKSEKRSEEFLYHLCTTLRVFQYLTMFPQWLRHYVPGFKKHNDYCIEHQKRLRAMIGEVLHERKVEIEKIPKDRNIRPDFLSTLLTINTERSHVSITKEGLARPLTEDEIQAIIIEILLGGVQKTAHSICFIIYYVCRNPQVLEKLLIEITNVIGSELNSSIPLEKLDQLVYCEAIILEASRLASVFPINWKQAADTDEIGGYNWKAGTVFYLHHQGVNMSSSINPNPKVFKPERHLIQVQSKGSTEVKVNKKRSYIFSRGIHMCPGRYMAMIQMKTFMVLLLSKFEVSLVDEHASLDTTFDIVNQCKEMKIILNPKPGVLLNSFSRPSKLARLYQLARQKNGKSLSQN
ncbi:hypothetical protein G9A89_021107 [Geosiphon pyriformis]|nr:hypothetical protein G9A89_021107 [Geosiphon pyriformis]